MLLCVFAFGFFLIINAVYKRILGKITSYAGLTLKLRTTFLSKSLISSSSYGKILNL